MKTKVLVPMTKETNGFVSPDDSLNSTTFAFTICKVKSKTAETGVISLIREKKLKKNNCRFF